ncbi:peptidase family M3-domain-containing protein [Jimgerdemannia flammicorona]|uniref:mitochondrial intermediate peptidase n=1 Tax=Jimgerdemannia flammicorona TaxID=994334 RepID=A0A433DJL7_9FUNG|nr:peptidase family M3-domain-containing protein [Jimgerdemannia flammicorona]
MHALVLRVSRLPRLVRPTQSSSPLLLRLHSTNTLNRTTAAPQPIAATFVSDTEPDEYLRLIFDDHHIWQFHRRPEHPTPLNFFQSHNSSHPVPPKVTGLFNNPDLATPRGFERAANKALCRARLIVERICRAPQNGDAEMRRVVKNLDRLSDTLCSVIDMAEFIRNTHPDREILEASNRAFEELCSYMNILNTDTSMHEVLVQVLATPTLTSTFTPEEHATALTFLRDFQKSGIHLPASQRSIFVTLSDRILSLGRDFTSANPRAVSHARVPPSRLEGVGSAFLKSVVRDDGFAYVSTTPYESTMVLKYAKDAEVRKEVYKAANSATDKSIGVLEDLVRARGELAKLVGKKSYAEVFLQDKMAKGPGMCVTIAISLYVWGYVEGLNMKHGACLLAQFHFFFSQFTTENVQTFLHTLLDHHLPKSRSDLLLLQQTKQRVQQLSFLPTINAWDRDFYINIYATSARPNTRLAPISPYFSLGSVMQGLSRLFHHLYGVRLEPAQTHRGETWHEDVRKLDVICERDGSIGTIYCDLFSRPRKMSNSAHYTVRTSRRVDDDDEAGDLLHGSPPSFFSHGSPPSFFSHGEPVTVEGAGRSIPSRPGRHQSPVVVLTCDFPPTSPTSPTLLNLHEVETLFHEMGHAMHSMLGRTDFHNLAGTRCATDFVELPSILMEHFVHHPHVLALFARHHATREPLPPALLARHVAQDRLFRALDSHAQILMALVDQHYHSADVLKPDFSAVGVWSRLQDSFGTVPNVPGTAWPTQFGHLFGYGAGYYSYLFDHALARRIWKKCFERDPLDRTMGERFRAEVVGWGGSRDAWKCVAGVLGGEDAEVLMGGDERAMKRVGEWGVESY